MNEFTQLQTCINRLYAIHYSCESLNDTNDGISPRVTSICIYHVQTKTTHNFAIHLEAEILGLGHSEVPLRYDDCEKNMLAKYFAYLKDNPGNVYLHWNMRNVVYGFEALEHRQRVLNKKEPFIIPDDNKFNLNDLFQKKYCLEYVSHKRMIKLMELNGGLPKDFLEGANEAEAFKKGEFIRLFNSTSDKAKWIARMFQKSLDGTLVVERSGWYQYSITIFDSTLYKVLGFLGIMASIFSFFK